jgi:hypothetical protein
VTTRDRPPNDRRPRLALRIGVTGHRPPRLPESAFGPVRTECTALLKAIADEARAVHVQYPSRFSDEPPLLIFVTALAEGADMICAEAALDCGYGIDVCLPFDINEYSKDFAPAAAAKLRALVGKARALLELPGTRRQESAAYEAAGKLVLQQSDMIISVWDGDSARGRGGTAEIVAEAVADHVPVINLDPADLQPPTLLWSGLEDASHDQPSLERVPRGPAAAHIAPLITALVAPPREAVDERMLNRFLANGHAGRFPAIPYPLLLAAAGIRSLRKTDLVPPGPEAATASLRLLIGEFAESGRFGAFLCGPLAHRYGHADSAATNFAGLFRSGFVANFALAALAVGLALSGIIVPGAKTHLISAELVVIAIIVLNTRRGAKLGWHELWMDNRHLAERLRTLSLSALLGNLALRAIEDSAAIPSWVAWYGRATAREMGLPTATMDAAYVASVRKTALGLIEEQLAYHRLNADRMRRLEHRLHHVGEWLFGTTIAACATWLTFRVLASPYVEVLGIGLTEIVTVTTALLPAVGAAIYGIRMQGDFAGIAENSEVTARRLTRLQRAVQTDPPDFQRLAARVRRLADIMLADVERWRLTYQTRPLTLPG